MSKVHLVVGGARSGKSEYAEGCAKALSKKVTYIATAIDTDGSMSDRIKKHIESRPSTWPTIEQYIHFKSIEQHVDFISADVILLDCMTVMMTNLMFAYHQDYEAISPKQIDEVERNIMGEFNNLIDSCKRYGKELILVTNEVGLGLVAPYKLGNYFRDISGRVNRYVATLADEVTFVAVGLPLKLKVAE